MKQLLPDVARLAQYRLERDLSFDQLAAAMQAAGFNVKSRGLANVLQGRLKESPRDRMLYKIHAFLAMVEKAPRRKPAKRRAPATRLDQRVSA